MKTLTRMLCHFAHLLLSYLDCVLGETTDSSKDDTETERDDKSVMIKGLISGFATFLGLLVFIFVMWCCCCVSDDSSDPSCSRKTTTSKNISLTLKTVTNNCKIGPSPPLSGPGRSHN